MIGFLEKYENSNSVILKICNGNKLPDSIKYNLLIQIVFKKILLERFKFKLILHYLKSNLCACTLRSIVLRDMINSNKNISFQKTEYNRKLLIISRWFCNIFIIIIIFFFLQLTLFKCCDFNICRWINQNIYTSLNWKIVQIIIKKS